MNTSPVCRATRAELQEHLEKSNYGKNSLLFDAYFYIEETPSSSYLDANTSATNNVGQSRETSSLLISSSNVREGHKAASSSRRVRCLVCRRFIAEHHDDRRPSNTNGGDDSSSIPVTVNSSFPPPPATTITRTVGRCKALPRETEFLIDRHSNTDICIKAHFPWWVSALVWFGIVYGLSLLWYVHRRGGVPPVLIVFFGFALIPLVGAIWAQWYFARHTLTFDLDRKTVTELWVSPLTLLLAPWRRRTLDLDNVEAVVDARLPQGLSAKVEYCVVLRERVPPSGIKKSVRSIKLSSGEDGGDRTEYAAQCERDSWNAYLNFARSA